MNVAFALRHGEVVHLVVRAARQQADEAEAADVRDLFRVGSRHDEARALQHIRHSDRPAVRTNEPVRPTAKGIPPSWSSDMSTLY